MDDDDISTCPICNLQVPFLQIERHANSHFEDEELARDIDLAKQISLASSISPLIPVDTATPSVDNSQKIPECRSARCESSSRRAMDIINEKLCCIRDLQIMDNFHKINDGLMTLLRKRLELDSENSTSILSGYIDHFQSNVYEDVGWGCGWRNIQMLTSHLLKQRQEAREVLFGGCGFVPDIASLQRWLEISWETGFDTLGSNDFGSDIYGKTNWIGTTECAALLRSFGIRARIVDFCSKAMTSNTSLPQSKHDRGRNEVSNANCKLQVYGPMDKYLFRGDCSTHTLHSNEHGKPNSQSKNLEKLGQQILIDWIWKYFSDHKAIDLNKNEVIDSGKPPLYFQHDGHSRTIIGIQVKSPLKGRKQFNLLILDPGHRSQALERSLKDNKGWQMLIKRGVHTLRKPQYQLCYIDPGIAGAEEMERLKTLDSDRFEF